MVKLLAIPTEIKYNYNDKCCLTEPSLKRNIVSDVQRTQENTNYRRRMHLIHLAPGLLIDSLCKKTKIGVLITRMVSTTAPSRIHNKQSSFYVLSARWPSIFLHFAETS